MPTLEIYIVNGTKEKFNIVLSRATKSHTKYIGMSRAEVSCSNWRYQKNNPLFVLPIRDQRGLRAPNLEYLVSQRLNPDIFEWSAIDMFAYMRNGDLKVRSRIPHSYNTHPHTCEHWEYAGYSIEDDYHENRFTYYQTKLGEVVKIPGKDVYKWYIHIEEKYYGENWENHIVMVGQTEKYKEQWTKKMQSVHQDLLDKIQKT
jgi:hypothetical protein